MQGMGAQVDAVSLSTADVFRWMVDEGLFPRCCVDKKQTEVAEKEIVEEGWCPQCGYPLAYHPGSDESGRFVCEVGRPMTGMPLVDFSALARHGAQMRTLRSRLYADPAMLVRCVDPRMTVAVRNVVGQSGLSCMRSLAWGPSSSISAPTKGEVEAHFAPYAVLALAVRSFVKVLVNGGVDVMRGEGERWRGKAGGRVLGPRTLLVPNQLLRWLEDKGAVGGVVGGFC
jgi:hypothetical protein